MPDVSEISSLETKIKEDSDFFNRLVELIPPRFYFATEIEDDDGSWKFNKKKSEKEAAKRKAKENSKKAKKLRFDPGQYQSTLDIQKQIAEQEKKSDVEQCGNDNGGANEAAANGLVGGSGEGRGQGFLHGFHGPGVNLRPTDLNRTVSHEELRERLHKRLAEFRARRHASESATAVRKAREWQAQRNTKRKPEGQSRQPAKRQRPDGGEYSAPKPAHKEPVEPHIHEQLEFGRVQISGGATFGVIKGKKKETKQELLAKAEALQKKMDKTADASEAQGLRSKHAWTAALARATGEKVLDDPKLLKKSLKRDEKMKERSAKQWKERTGKEKEQMELKQRKRKDNIKARADTKKAKRIEKREKKLLRPGFEGRREGFINAP